MSSRRQHAPELSVPGFRRWARRLMVAGLTLGLIGAASLTAVPTASADPSTSPRSGNFYVTGAGFGHGWGMSQYGAYGAARQGLTWKQILAFYYPKTVRQALPGTGTIRVCVTADSDGTLGFKPAAGAELPPWAMPSQNSSTSPAARHLRTADRHMFDCSAD